MGAPARSGLRHDARSSPASRSCRYAVRGRAGRLRPAGRTQAAQSHGAEAAGGTRRPAAPSAPAAQPKGAPSAQPKGPHSAQPKGAPDGKESKGGTSGAPAKPAPAGAAKPAAGSPGPGGAKATLLASFRDWGAYASGDSRTKICYALSQPKERLPKDLKRDPGYLFVSFRPADNVRNEVAVVLGFATRDGGEAEAVVGQSTYALVTKGSNAWVRNPTEESQIIAAFTKGQSITVKATSGRSNAPPTAFP